MSDKTGLQVQAAFIPTATACELAVKGLTGDERTDAWDAEFDRIRIRVDAYMPSNYVTIMHTHSLFVIGRDNAGWTLTDYVLPRLASGGVFGQVECDQSTLAALTAKVMPSDPPDDGLPVYGCECCGSGMHDVSRCPHKRVTG
ncbi:MAG: hypothetical protein GWP91_05535 [Rhodobacterales bacterium]|nr:hypothetical protein [Rhodobacterales bacterium]